MIIRSKAPLRIGFAGGGTDLEAFSNVHGGAVVNATISMYAYCTIIPADDGKIRIYAADNNNDIETAAVPRLEADGDRLILHRGVYNRIVKDFNGGKPLSFTMSTSNDAPVGSGLGTSSTMIVALLEAFRRWLNIRLDNYELAQLAYDIERKDLHLSGGKQDQYSAVFGGINYMEFLTDGSVQVSGINLNDGIINEFENSLLLYYSGISHKSDVMQLKLAKNIINNQISHAESKENGTVEALLSIKRNAARMRRCFEKGDMNGFAAMLREGWEQKKRTSDIVSNVELERDIEYAMMNGAEAVKVSGAGGGGFLLLYCNPVNRQKLFNALRLLDGRVYFVKFSRTGAESWVVGR